MKRALGPSNSSKIVCALALVLAGCSPAKGPRSSEDATPALDTSIADTETPTDVASPKDSAGEILDGDPPLKYQLRVEPLDLSTSVDPAAILMVVPLRYDTYVATDAEKALLGASLRRLPQNTPVAMSIAKKLIVLDRAKHSYELEYRIRPQTALKGWYALDVDLPEAWFMEPGKRSVRFSTEPYPMVRHLRICWHSMLEVSISFSEAVSPSSADAFMALSQGGTPLSCQRQNTGAPGAPQTGYRYVCPNGSADDVSVTLREIADSHSGLPIRLLSGQSSQQLLVPYKLGCTNVDLGKFVAP